LPPQCRFKVLLAALGSSSSRGCCLSRCSFLAPQGCLKVLTAAAAEPALLVLLLWLLFVLACCSR
jgi:hypothetical protein